MREAVSVSLQTGGESLPIDSIDASGVRLEQEIDAWPRGLALEFDAASQVTATRLKWIRELKGWQSWEFRLNVALEDDALVFKGVDDRSFPPGSYWFRLQIEDLNIRGGKQTFSVDEGERLDLPLEVTPDPRRIVLTDVATWDPAVRDLITRPGQTIDDLPVLDWLGSDAPRENRKACLLNLMAKLRSSPKGENPPFLSHVQQIFLADSDRIYVEIEADFRQRLHDLADDPDTPFKFEGRPASASHLRLLEKAATLTDTTRYQLESYRQEGRNSMQVVVAVPPHGEKLTIRQPVMFTYDTTVQERDDGQAAAEDERASLGEEPQQGPGRGR